MRIYKSSTLFLKFLNNEKNNLKKISIENFTTGIFEATTDFPGKQAFRKVLQKRNFHILTDLNYGIGLKEKIVEIIKNCVICLKITEHHKNFKRYVFINLSINCHCWKLKK